MIRIIYSLKQKYIELINSNRENGIPIYMFHHVNDLPNSDDISFNIRVNEFIEFIKDKINNQVCFITPHMLGQSLGCNSCMLTFDDGLKDAFLNAVPILEKYGIPYVFFISPIFVGENGYISLNDLEYLRGSKYCTLGAHGLHHKMFRFLSMESKKHELSRQVHEEFLGCDIEDFAFPYGSIYAVDNRSLQLAGMEYKRVYMTLHYKSNITDFNSFFPRISINSTCIKNKGKD